MYSNSLAKVQKQPSVSIMCTVSLSESILTSHLLDNWCQESLYLKDHWFNVNVFAGNMFCRTAFLCTDVIFMWKNFCAVTCIKYSTGITQYVESGHACTLWLRREKTWHVSIKVPVLSCPSPSMIVRLPPFAPACWLVGFCNGLSQDCWEEQSFSRYSIVSLRAGWKFYIHE